MNAPLVFNRRLGKGELDLIINLFEQGEIDPNQAAKFLELEDTIVFVSSIKDEIIGGTIVYRDRTRLGMVLAGVAIKKEHRDQGAYTIIKSSLPFFRTVAIRDVDALVSETFDKEVPRIPFSFHLPKWTGQFLERNGFSNEQKLYSCTIEFEHERKNDGTRINFDSVTNIEGAKSLLWDTGKITGLTNSVIWMSLDLAAFSKTLKTVSENKATKLVFSLSTHNRITSIGLVVADEEFLTNNQAATILASAITREQPREVRFPLIGPGQLELLDDVADEVGGLLKCQSITLMRRRL